MLPVRKNKILSAKQRKILSRTKKRKKRVLVFRRRGEYEMVFACYAFEKKTAFWLDNPINCQKVMNCILTYIVEGHTTVVVCDPLRIDQ